MIAADAASGTSVEGRSSFWRKDMVTLGVGCDDSIAVQQSSISSAGVPCGFLRLFAFWPALCCRPVRNRTRCRWCPPSTGPAMSACAGGLAKSAPLCRRRAVSANVSTPCGRKRCAAAAPTSTSSGTPATGRRPAASPIAARSRSPGKRLEMRRCPQAGKLVVALGHEAEEPGRDRPGLASIGPVIRSPGIMPLSARPLEAGRADRRQRTAGSAVPIGYEFLNHGE